jgi:hypothetical protein
MSEFGEFKRNNYLVNHPYGNPYENKAFVLTAEQQKELERKVDLEWTLYYLKKAIRLFGDIKISDAIAKTKHELEPKINFKH